MTRWECQQSGCSATAVGCGGGVNLRAIGWYFVEGHEAAGPLLLCPRHRPDGVSFCRNPGDAACVPCGVCAGDIWAEAIGELIRDHNADLEARIAG